jgi:argininosuccinate lyase
MSEHTSQTNQSWGGRFTQPTDEFVQLFNASVDFDKQLAPFDIAGSIAHATMLAECEIISQDEKELIVKGLQDVLAEIENGTFVWSYALEDVHMNIEARLVEIIGDTGKKLHTGRSRNDQVATDIRLYLREKIDTIIVSIEHLQVALLDLATKHTTTIMPGFTHLQAAQPISFAHHLMAYYEMLMRDKNRFQDTRKRTNVMPLGSAALAGTTYPIQREITAKLLEFEAISQNSLDAVSDRDFAIEFLSTSSMLMMHLSRFSEELIIWSSAQFNFVELSDSYSTGSSIMPQKKNPDMPELVRGKTGRVYGNLTALLTIMKGQTLAYNKDNQEDKEPLFDTVQTVENSLKIFAGMMSNIDIKAENMRESAIKGYTTATDLADYLVKKGLPFRDSHEVVGNCVAFGITQHKDLAELELTELQQFSNLIDEDVFDVLTLEGSLCARDHLGGTAPKQVSEQIQKNRDNK